MRPPNNCAPTRGKVEARGDTKALDASVPRDAQAGKWLAMVLYNSRVADIGAPETAFARHSAWRLV